MLSYRWASGPESSTTLRLEEFARWRYQLDVRQVECLVEFLRMRQRAGCLLEANNDDRNDSDINAARNMFFRMIHWVTSLFGSVRG